MKPSLAAGLQPRGIAPQDIAHVGLDLDVGLPYSTPSCDGQTCADVMLPLDSERSSNYG